MNRRGFLLGAGGILASMVAPAIIRPGVLMPVKPVLLVPVWERVSTMADPLAQYVTVREWLPYTGRWDRWLDEGVSPEIAMPVRDVVMTIDEFHRRYPNEKVFGEMRGRR